MNKGKIKESDLLKEKYGSEITLYDDEDNEYVFHLLLELVTEDRHYAYFQSPDNEEGDIEVLRVVQESDDLDLQYIEDDEEWESAAELFDEWTDLVE